MARRYSHRPLFPNPVVSFFLFWLGYILNDSTLPPSVTFCTARYEVVRMGKTFAYSASGRQGLLTGKKATLLIASGGVYDQGSAAEALNFVTPYLHTIFGFMGITDVNIIAAGGTQKLMTGEVDSQTFLAPSLAKVHAQASL